VPLTAQLLRWGAAFSLCALGASLLVPARNRFGNPAFEQELQRCTFADGTLIRLYEGDGGATTAYWYTVTHAKGWREPERQVYYAYGYPEVKEVTCRPEAVVLTLAEAIGEKQESLYLERIRRELRRRPVAFSRGERLAGRGLRPIRLGLGAFLVVLGVGLGLWRRGAARGKVQFRGLPGGSSR
jgi:hypothetical protein